MFVTKAYYFLDQFRFVLVISYDVLGKTGARLSSGKSGAYADESLPQLCFDGG